MPTDEKKKNLFDNLLAAAEKQEKENEQQKPKKPAKKPAVNSNTNEPSAAPASAGPSKTDPYFKQSKDAHYDPASDTIYAPSEDDEFFHHEKFHARPDAQLLDRLRPYYSDLNDDKLKSMGADMDFIMREGNDPNHFYSPEELGARVSAAKFMLNRQGVTGIDKPFLESAREDELKYGDNFRDLLHMYNDETLLEILNDDAKASLETESEPEFDESTPEGRYAKREWERRQREIAATEKAFNQKQGEQKKIDQKAENAAKRYDAAMADIEKRRYEAARQAMSDALGLEQNDIDQQGKELDAAQRAARFAGIAELATSLVNLVGVGSHQSANQAQPTVARDWMGVADAKLRERRQSIRSLSERRAQLAEQLKQIGLGNLEAAAKRDAAAAERERKRREEWEAKLAPFKALRQTINEHDELMAETLYEVTLLELGEMEE